MDPRTAAPPSPDPDAVEFVRFCYRRRRVGWPELYDEMCAVAHRGLFRGFGCDDLAARGIGFGLFEMPRLAALAARIVEEEKAARRPVQVMIERQPEATPVIVATEAAIVPAATAGARADHGRETAAPVRGEPAEAASSPVFARLAVAAGA